MKNLLILNFGTSKDVLMSAQLISSLRDENPALNISLLTKKKHFAIAKLLAHVSHIHTIDTNYIEEVERNELYPDVYALNEFSATTEELVRTNWDDVINYSNDEFSSYFIKALNASHIHGTYISEAGVSRTTNNWATVQNYVLSKTKNPSIAIPLLRNQMMKLPIQNHISKVKVSEEYLMMAHQNFMKVRKMKGHIQTKIIGINLEVGYSGHALSLDILMNLIETLEESEQFKVILLTSGKSFQKELINTLNKSFSNKLISINLETDALSAVLSNLDLMVSSANDQLLIADSLGIKLIEVKSCHLENAPTAISEGSAIIYQKNSLHMSDDIILSINEEFETELPVTAINNANPTYICIQDDYGVSYSQMRGDIDIQDQLRRHVERSVLFQCLGFSKNEKLLEQIQKRMDKGEVEAFVKNTRAEVTETVKALLATLRSLKGAKTSKNQLDSFVTYFGELIEHSRNNTLTSSLVKLFEGHVDNIDSTSSEDNMHEIENYLFELKGNLQVLMSFVGEMLEEKEDRKAEELHL